MSRIHLRVPPGRLSLDGADLDDVAIVQSPHGTTVTLTKDLKP